MMQTPARLPRPLMKLMTLALLHLVGTSMVQSHRGTRIQWIKWAESGMEEECNRGRGYKAEEG